MIVLNFERLLRENLRGNFKLYDESHVIRVVGVDRKILVGYSQEDRRASNFDQTSFALQFEKDICYLMSIQLESAERGKGFGKGLYLAAYHFARSLDYNKIRQTPSGWTKNGETRLSVLLRNGHEPFEGNEVDFDLNRLGQIS